jgi:hypothetical protein
VSRRSEPRRIDRKGTGQHQPRYREISRRASRPSFIAKPDRSVRGRGNIDSGADIKSHFSITSLKALAPAVTAVLLGRATLVLGGGSKDRHRTYSTWRTHSLRGSRNIHPASNTPLLKTRPPSQFTQSRRIVFRSVITAKSCSGASKIRL